MNASKASARDEEKPDETYRLPCLTCARRARRWRTVATVSQWVALSGFTVTIGFAASELQYAAAKLNLATECPRAPQQRAELERAQREAPKVPLVAVEPAPLRPVVTPYVGGSLPFTNRPPRDAPQDEQRLMSRSEHNDSEEKQVRRVEDAPAESDAKLNSDSTEVE